MGLSDIKNSPLTESKPFTSEDQKRYEERNQMIKTMVLDKFVYNPKTCDIFLESKGRDPTITKNRVNSCRGKAFTAIALIISAAILLFGIIFALQSEFNQFLSADLVYLYNYLSFILIIVGVVGLLITYWLNRQFGNAVKKTYSEFRGE